MEPRIRRRHLMPFGAQLSDAGEVCFRLWAPAARQVDLVLYEGAGERLIRMSAHPEGWFALQTAAARTGSRYRYRIDASHTVPDPASRSNPQGVHGPSEVVDPAAFAWEDGQWRAPPWHTAVIYELHVGTFAPQGTFAGVEAHLAHLARLGVTALELMPVAAFPGTRDWGYDGVLQYAPQTGYGRPEELKALIAAAHRHGLAVLLDVVYNHFGPEGNYLHLYAPQFFTDRHPTPWGAGINFDGPGSRTVRDFFIHNALYWLEEFHFDGLRLDAIHAIHDESEPHIVREIATAVRSHLPRERTVYLTVENFDNGAHFLGPAGTPAVHDAQWNDDAHHCLHVLLTGESAGYYGDYSAHPRSLLRRCLREGFAYQGEPSAWCGGPRGEPSAQLPPSAFVNFLQNHDQVGNRAAGERLAQLVRDREALRAAAAVLLLAPFPPLLFMGEEWAAPEPFPWFCDFEPQLAAQVRIGRERECPGGPDPTAIATFESARLDWSKLGEPQHAAALEYYRMLLAIRRREIAPLLSSLGADPGADRDHGDALTIHWSGGGVSLRLLANLSAHTAQVPERAPGRVLFATHAGLAAAAELPPWSVMWKLESTRGRS